MSNAGKRFASRSRSGAESGRPDTTRPDTARPDELRAFFGLALGDEVRRAAEAVASRLRAALGSEALRWTRPQSYHLTLRFLGNIPRQRVESLASGVGAAVASLAPFELPLAAPTALPSSRRPRVLVLDVAACAELEELARRVEGAVVAAGIPAETRPLRPHVTLARLRRAARAPRMLGPLGSEAAEGTPIPPLAVREVVLFRSELRAGGSRYSPLAQLPLGHAAPDASPSATRASEGDDSHGQARTQP